MIDLTVISGGQTGSDQGGLRAARSCGLVTGGWAPLGWATEDGPAPWLAAWGLQECPEPGYPARTARNAAWGDVTLWFGTGDTRGYWCTRNAVLKAGKPFREIKSRDDEPWQVANWLLYHQFKTLNCAGNRESSSPGIGVAVELYLTEVFRVVKGA